MSEWAVHVVKISGIEKHANADTLSIVQVDGGYPCIFRTGELKEGDLAVYIPIDSVVPFAPEFEFLGKHHRIVAKRLRGVFSMGLLIPAKPGMKEGDVVDKVLNIEKWEPEIEAIGKGRHGSILGGEEEKDPGFIPVYTDIDGYRKHHKRFNEIIGDKEVVITEKVHGCQARYVYVLDNKGKLWVGSHKKIKRSPFYIETLWQKVCRHVVGTFALCLFVLLRRKLRWTWMQRIFVWARTKRLRDIPDNLWCQAARKYDLYNKMKKYPSVVFMGEIYGQVQDLKYGAGPAEIFLRFYDGYDVVAKRYLDWDDVVKMVEDMGLEMVPVLYRGPWKEDLTEMRNGMTVISRANHVREGFVVHPTSETWDYKIQRVILKFVGEDYLLRKGA